MSEYIPVPVRAAEHIATEFDKDQVVIVSCNKEQGRIHFTSFGKSAIDKLDAAKVSYLMQKFFYDIDVPDGAEAPYGFENFHWCNETNDFVEKD